MRWIKEMWDEGRRPPNALCRDCGEPIRWVKTVAGKNMPLNLVHSDDGHWRISCGRAEYLRAGEVEIAHLRRERLYTCHFDTCKKKVR